MRLLSRIKNTIKNDHSLVLNIFAAGGIKGLAILINILTTPAYMNYFNDSSVLGVWLTLISILTTVSVLDFGLGNGLRNKLAETVALGDDYRSRRLISSGYFSVATVSMIVLILGMITIPFLDWNVILGVDKSVLPPENVVACIRIVFVAVVIQMVLKMITSVLYAQQKSALVSVLPVVTNLIMLLTVLVVPSSTAQINIRRLSEIYLFASTLPYLVVTIILFCGRYRKLRPSSKHIKGTDAFDILGLGIKFFYLSLMSMMVHNTNEILISALFESAAVVEYQIYNKVFYLITTVINVLMIPLWSRVTKALAQKEYIWIKKLHEILCMTSVIAFGVAMFTIPFMQVIVNIWLGDNSIVINKVYCVPFAIYVAIETWNGANATVANGTGWIKAQMLMAPLTAVLNIGFTLLFRNILESWIAIQYANIVSLVPIAIVQYIYIRKQLKKVGDKL